MKSARLGLLVSLSMLQVAAGIPAQKEKYVGAVLGGWGYIDKLGNVIVQPRFDWAGRFADGLARVVVGNKWGYIDRAGRQVIPAQFEEAGDFSEGLAAVKVNGKWGYSDKTGNVVIAPTFEAASGFSEGLAQVEFATAFGYVDKTGKFAIKPQFILAHDFSEGLAGVLVCKAWNAEGAAMVSESEGCGWGYINNETQFVIQPKFRDARPFSEGLAAVWDGRNWGYIDKDGNAVIPLQFHCHEIGPFREGLALVDGVGGIDAAIILREGRIFVSIGYIDRSGKWVIRSRLHYWFSDDFSEGLVPVATSPKKSSKYGHTWRYGYFDLSGKLSVKPQFDEAGSFSEGLAPARIGPSCGYIDKTGKFVINLQFAGCGGFSEGLSPVGVVTTK